MPSAQQPPPPHGQSWTGRVALLVPPPDGPGAAGLAPVRPGAASRTWLESSGAATLSLSPATAPGARGAVAARFGLGGREIAACWLSGPVGAPLAACWARGRVVSFTCPDPSRPGKQRAVAFRFDLPGGARDCLSAARRLAQPQQGAPAGEWAGPGDADIKGWIERTLMDPTFESFVDKVEEAWVDLVAGLEPWMTGAE